MAQPKLVKLTQVNVTQEMADSGQVENLARVETLYQTAKTARIQSIQLTRRAAVAQAQATKAAADAAKAAADEQAALAEFFEFVGEQVPLVAEEPVWMRPFKKGEDIIVESPMTSKDVRRAVRNAHAQQQIQSKNLDDYKGMFGGDDENNEEEEKD